MSQKKSNRSSKGRSTSTAPQQQAQPTTCRNNERICFLFQTLNSMLKQHIDYEHHTSQKNKKHSVVHIHELQYTFYNNGESIIYANAPLTIKFKNKLNA